VSLRSHSSGLFWRSGHTERVQKADTIGVPELHGLIDTADGVPYIDESGLGTGSDRLRPASNLPGMVHCSGRSCIDARSSLVSSLLGQNTNEELGMSQSGHVGM